MASWFSTLTWLVAQAAPVVDAAATDAAAEAAPDGMSGTLKLLVALGVIVGSFLLGGLLANALRMKDYAFRLGVVIFSLVAGIAICYFGWPPKRGIDLSGGVVLVYEVDTSTSSSDWMQDAVEKMNDELNADGGEKLDAKPVGEDRIEIVVPKGVDLKDVEKKVDDMRDAVGVVLNLESRNKEENGTVLLYRADKQQQRDLDMSKLIGAVQRRINPGGVKELTIRQYGAEQIEVIIPEVEEREVETIKKKISTSGLLNFRIVANPTDDRELIKVGERTTGRDVYIGGRLAGKWVKAGPELPQSLQPPRATYRKAPDGSLEILVRIDPFNVDGRYLTRAGVGTDERGGFAVDFSFDTIGAEKFRMLTSRNLPDEATGLERNLGIILDNVMLSAPNIISTISNRGQITGRFTEDQVSVLVGVLNAGSLPASLRPEPISQQRISAQLGDDTIRAGANAMIISTAAILVFMLVYYRFAGAIADVAVTLNVIITVALMILIKAAFTLPGLAGLVLTVGMAVDANVLIYERIREESERGSSLRMAIRNGFSRATGTIVDANITTLITAIVLYVIGTDQIKGFAVTLILGLLVSMFTAIFVSRVIFDIAERKRLITSLKMMRVVGHTSIDFIRYRGPALAVSLVLIAIGLAAMVSRGKELLDIDFTGGSSVQVVFADDKPQNISEVRKAVAELPDVAVSSVGEERLEFKIDTSDREISHVQGVLKETFGDDLKTYSMTYSDVNTIEAKPASSTEKSEPPAAGESTVEEQPSDTKAATPASPPEEETAPADAPEPAESAAPENPQSRVQRASPFRFASYLQDATQDEENPSPEAEKPAAEETPAAAEPSEATPKEETAAVAPPADATEVASDDSKPADDDAGEPITQEVGGDVSMVGGTRADLTFAEPIAHGPLSELVQQQLDEMKLSEAGFRLTNPEYQQGSEQRYASWTFETTLKADETKQLLDGIKATLAGTPVFPSSSEIGGKVAGDTQMMAIYAMLASMVMIVLYVWIRFQNVIFGLAAVVALLHDVLVSLAFLAMSFYLSPYMEALLVDPFKVSLPVVAALLTIVGFSINDTIVIFDRIREVRGKSPDLTPDMINKSVNQTLSRTILTSGTVFIASIILYIVGGPGIHAFAYTMVVGIIAGTYSSVYIAAPVLLWLRKPSSTPPSKNEAYPAAAGRGN